MVAFDLGIAAGADGLELDVHLSADGQVVAIHDATLDRSTRSSGTVSQKTAAELGALDATPFYGIDLELPWTGARAGLPLLRDVLERHPLAATIIELKGSTPALGPAVVDVVRAAGAEARVCLASFSSGVLSAARMAGPELATSASREEGLRALQCSWTGLPFPRRRVYSAFQVPERSGRLKVASRRFVRAVHRAGCAVQVWTVNEEADMRRLMDLGVDGLITDRPDLAVRVRDAWVAERHHAGHSR